MIAKDKPQAVKLTKQQQAAFKKLTSFVGGNRQFFRLTGYAGTGKTFLICQLLELLRSQKKQFVVAAPTNKAVKNVEKMAQANGISLEALTIAKLLGQLPKIDKKSGKEVFLADGDCNLSNYDLAIVDEYSMVNKDNFTQLVQQAGRRTKIVFVGDNAQLPPVGESLSMVASSPIIKDRASLSEVVRYDGEIARVAEEIRSKSLYNSVLYPFETATDGTIKKFGDRFEWLREAGECFTDPKWREEPNLCRVLVFRNRTASILNDYIRERIYGEKCRTFEMGDLLIARFPCFREFCNKEGKPELKIVVQNSEEMTVSGDYTIDKIVKANVEYDFYRVPVTTESGRDIDLRILTPDSQVLLEQEIRRYQERKRYDLKWWLFKSFDNCPFAYCLTVHKAQGSSIDKVFLEIDDMASCPDKQKMMYTALTRAKQTAFVY